MMTDELGGRFKKYEDSFRIYLPDRLPVIIRLDGKSFHTYTKGLRRPYSLELFECMDEIMLHLCKNIQNVALAFTESDEISLLLVNFRDINTDSWFDNNLQKMISISAAMASAKLTQLSHKLFGETKLGYFDSRAFVLPVHDVENYFHWRQADIWRNSLQMLAQSLYSHKELMGKKHDELHQMIYERGYNWAKLSSHIKNGRIAIKHPVEREFTGHLALGEGPTKIIRSEWYIPEETPIFTENRQLIRDLMEFKSST